MIIECRTEIVPIYSKCESRFVKGNAKAQAGSMYRDILDGFGGSNRSDNLPKDIISIYRVAPENPSTTANTNKKLIYSIQETLRYNEEIIEGENWKGIWQTRWALGCRVITGDHISKYIIIPYAVAFRKNEFGNPEEFISINQALDEAYEYYTTNKKSKIKQFIISDIRGFTDYPYIENDYYSLVPHYNDGGVTYPVVDEADYTFYMYNDFYYVFIRGYGKVDYHLTLKEDIIKYDSNLFTEAETKEIIIYGSIICGILAVLWIILFVLYLKERREIKKTTLQRIIKKSNPMNYINKYKERDLEIANEIYSEALTLNETNVENITKLASRMETDLGISMVYKNDIVALKKLCNPKKFMKPYDAEKVAKANLLYGKLSQTGISYADFSQIKDEVNNLS